MGRTLTLQNIMDAVRLRGEWRASWLTDAELLSYVQDSVAALHDMLLAIDPRSSLLLGMGVVPVVAGTALYDLPSDFGIILGVSVKDGTSADGYVALERMEFEQRYADDYDNTAKTSARWDLFGDRLRLQPTPNWTGELRLEYCRTFAPTGLASQAVDFENSWHEWTVLDVCVKCCAKEETDPSVYAAQQKAVQERIGAVMRTADNIDSEARSPSATGLTLADIRRAVRARGGWRLGEVSDAVITGVVNSSVRALEDVVIGINPTHSSMLRRSDITVVAGTGLYSLPSNLHTILGVSVRDGSTADGYAVLERFNWDERLADGYAGAGKANARWARWGSQIMIEPVPDWSGVIRVEYAGRTALTGDPTQSLDIGNGWSEWIIANSCLMLCPRMKMDPAPFAAQVSEIEKRIAASVRAEEMTTQFPRRGSSGTTLADLRRAARGRGAWMRADISDTQLTEWINASIRELVDFMVVRDPSFFVSRTDIDVVVGTRLYNLPSDMWKLLGAAVVDETAVDGYCVLQRHSWDERYDTVWSNDKLDTRYLIVGDQLELHPTPNWSGTIRLEYAPYPTALSEPSDTFDFRNGAQEWVVLDACAKAALATGKDPAPWMAMRDASAARLSSGLPRDAAKPKRVVDTWRRGGADRARRLPWPVR
jgi:hypothetical protein